MRVAAFPGDGIVVTLNAGRPWRLELASTRQSGHYGADDYLDAINEELRPSKNGDRQQP